VIAPNKRHFIAALGVSALLHLFLLWQVPLSLPENEAELPPLQAKLETLPPAPPAQPPRKPKRRSPPTPAPAAPPVPTAEDAAPAAVAPQPQAASAVAATSAEPAAEPIAPPAQDPPPLPKRAMLKYDVRLDEDGITVGDVRHSLEIEDGRYTLKATIRTTGLARLIKYVYYNQLSRGTVSAAGLRPDYAQEDKNLDGRLQNVEIFFDRAGNTLRFSLGGETSLTEDAQDRLSLLYQLSRLQLGAATLPLAVTDGRKLERYQVRIDQEEEIMTPMGKLRTLPVRKIHAPGEEGMDIWLALEYRLLPVKVVRFDRNGQPNGVIVIREIRLSDDPSQ
jgi:hypothetical protein